MNKREEITFRKRDEWIHSCIDKIVNAKRDAGMRTSFSYEMTRLARNALLNEMRGADMDRKILRGEDDE